MIMTRSTALRDARAQVHVTALSGGKIAFYDGSMPTAGEAVTTQVKLVEIAIPNPAGTVADGVFTLAANLEDMAAAESGVTWARITDSTGAWLMDMDVGADGSGAAIEFEFQTTTQIHAGGTLRFKRLRLIEP